MKKSIVIQNPRGFHFGRSCNGDRSSRLLYAARAADMVGADSFRGERLASRGGDRPVQQPGAGGPAQAGTGRIRMILQERGSLCQIKTLN